MLHIHCSGTPYEIGLIHGHEGAAQVAGSIRFYANLFASTAKLTWPQVRTTALSFESSLRRKWPAYLQEMCGVADGAGVEVADIIALNVRTEISFGLFSDGCSMYIAQNWDWQPAQLPNLLHLTITSHLHPTIQTITEAGILSKIGLNDSHVAVTLNAIRAPGMDPTRLPCHLALRLALSSTSTNAAFEAIEKHGVASACVISIADGAGDAVCLECSAVGIQKVFPDRETGKLYHTNHYILPHAGVKDSVWLPDSIPRLERIREKAEALAKSNPEPGVDELGCEVFCDEKGWPNGICRDAEGKEGRSETLFNFIADLRNGIGLVKLGKPTENREKFSLDF
ncbi:AAT-domain-containing protein [Saccharata proteae CBS 121410]|uniref:AAT-domain-containing protein n=1 Tax=Saccharata proteae CBS 121410 TaxID=1314787 RepID=A0A9P4M036_9PEZI|nr:AAT-domain-containing protein [Saccharata proteae CBS 121410]